MKCFLHQESDAIGVCKACNKAVCITCSLDTGRGISCSEACSKEIDEQNQIIDKSKKIYSIGKKPALMPTGLLLYFFFGILFTGFGLYQGFERGAIEWLSLLMGLGFIIIGFIGWYKNRQLNLNC